MGKQRIQNENEEHAMKYKFLIIDMLLRMDNLEYLAKTYHYLLVKYRKEKGIDE